MTDFATTILLVFAVICFTFTGVCVVKFCAVMRESREESDAIARWWKEREKYRTSSSVEDDSPNDSRGGAA